MMTCIHSPVAPLRRVARFTWVAHGIGGALLCLLLAGSMQSATAQFRDVGYTFEPTVQGIFEDDAAPFQNEPLYGGALGLSFGRYFQASAEYLVNTGLTTDFLNVDRLQGLVDRNVDVRRYGARLRFNLFDRRIIPYVTAGSGVLQFDPDGAELSRTIYALAGGGITFRVQDRYRVSVGGEMMNYRYDPVATFLGPTGAQNFETGTDLVSVPSVNASVSLFLGGRSLEEQTLVDRALQEQFGGRGFLRGVQLFVHPFQGRIEFNDALGFPKDQNVAGVDAGLSLGPYVGLRGFYWRGTKGANVTDEFARGFEDIQMYGGELQLRLNFDLGRGFVPYAKVGGGYLDVLDGYADDIPEGTTPPEDRFMGTSGLGLEVPLTNSIKLSGGARALLMTNPNVVEAGDPGDLYGSLMYSAGIEFRLGRGGRRTTPDVDTEPLLGRTDDRDDESADPGTGDPGPDRDDLSPRERQLLARADSLERVLESMRAGVSGTEPASTAESQPPAERSNVSGQTMTIPVPETGEIYIRFGGDDGPSRIRRDTTARSPSVARQAGEPPVTRQELERRVAEALRAELRQQNRPDTARALTNADLERLIERTIRDVVREQATGSRRDQEAVRSQEIQRLEQQIDALRQQLRQRPVEQQTTSISETTTRDVPFYRETLGRPLMYVVPVTGFRAGEGPDQFQIGVRGDYRNTPNSRFHLVPELSFGFGGGSVAPTILLGAAYSFLRATTTNVTGFPIEPYIGAGVGIASDGGFTFEPVTNVMLGFDYRLQGGRLLFLEYSTLDLLNTHRVHIGYRLRF